MLFNATPVNISLSASIPNAAPDLAANAKNRFLFTRDGKLFCALLNVAGASPGILRSSDLGATWAIADPGFSLPTATNIDADTVGDTIFLCCQNGADFVVVQFDMATEAYTATSPTLTIAEPPPLSFEGNAGGLCASNGDFYLFFDYLNTGDFSLGPLAYHVLSAGVWSTPHVALDAQPVFLNFNLTLGRDSAGDVHLFYEHINSNDFVHDFPHELRHIKPGGSPGIIQSIPATGQSFNAFDAIAWHGALYVSNTKNESLQTVFVSDSDIAPTSWSEVSIDPLPMLPAISALGQGKFVADIANDLLYLFYVNGNSNGSALSLWYSVLSGGIWGAPILVYDVASNPPPGLSVAVTSVIFRSLSVVLMDGAFYAVTDFTVGGAGNAFLLRAGSAARSYMF